MAEMTVRLEGGVELAENATVAIDSSQILKTQEFANQTSFFASGYVSEPDADQEICSLTPPAGFYKVDITRSADGSGTPVLYNNANFRVGVEDHILVQIPELGVIYNYTFYVGLDGSTPIGVRQVDASSLNIVITAQIVATRYA